MHIHILRSFNHQKYNSGAPRHPYNQIYMVDMALGLDDVLLTGRVIWAQVPLFSNQVRLPKSLFAQFHRAALDLVCHVHGLRNHSDVVANEYDICLFLLWCPGCPRLFCDFEANVYFLFVSIIVCLPDGPMMWSEAPSRCTSPVDRGCILLSLWGPAPWYPLSESCFGLPSRIGFHANAMQMLYDLIRIISHHAWDIWNSNIFKPFVLQELDTELMGM